MLASQYKPFTPAAFALAAAACLQGTVYAQQLPSGGKKITGSVVVFDARQREFISKLQSISATKPVTLVAKNVNTFREKYILSLKTEDRHNISTPNALAGFILTKTPTFGGGGSAGLTPKLPANLQPPYEAVNTAVREFHKTIDDLDVPHTEITAILKEGATNFEIRKQVIGRIHRGAPGVETQKIILYSLVSTELPDDVEDDVDTFRRSETEIRDVTKAIQVDAVNALQTKLNEVNAKQAVWADAVQMFLGTNRTIEDALKDPKTKSEDMVVLKEVQAAISQVTKSVNESRAEFADFSKSRVFIAEIYTLFMNPLIVPTKITKRLDNIRADYINPTVLVEQSLSALLLPTDPAASTQVKTLAAGDNPTFSSRTYTANLPVYNRVVLDFSAGAIWTDLQQKYYYISPNADNASLKGVREGIKDRGNGGVGVLAHLYPTTKFPLGFTGGPCLGVAASDPQRFLVGLSAVAHLNRVRVMYSYGAAYGKQNRLNGDVLNGDLLTPPVAPLGSSPSVQSVFRWGHFHGVTLSFSF